MNNFTYENQGTNTYLVYTIQQEDAVDSMSLGMLTNNKISGLAPAIFTQMDTTKYIKYNVSAKVSVKQFFSGPVNKNRLVGVFKGIVDAMFAAEEYMIDTNSILLDLEYIFADVSTCETTLICLPIMRDLTEYVDLSDFFKRIMFSTQFDQTENCDYVAKIINYLNSTPIFSLVDFNGVLEKIQGEKIAGNTPQPVVLKTDVVTPQQIIEESKQLNKVSPQSEKQLSVIQQPVKSPLVKQPVAVSKTEVTKKEQHAVNVPQGNSFQIPQTPVSTTGKPEAVKVGSEDKEISLFYLLQHYNKENAAAYKAQKEAKKRMNGQKQGDITPTVSQTNIPQPVVKNVQPKVNPMAPQVQPTLSQPQKSQGAIPDDTSVQHDITQRNSMNFGETTILNSGKIGETTVLNLAMNPAQQTNAHLIRIKNNEKIVLDKPIYRIGKERSYVDYFIGDNTAVSRSHANIINRDGMYFIVDTNSTNHTFVNGEMIQSNIEVQLQQDDKIRLANEEFEFKLY